MDANLCTFFQARGCVAFILGTHRVCDPKTIAPIWKPLVARGGKGQKQKQKHSFSNLGTGKGPDRGLSWEKGPHNPPMRDSTGREACLCQSSGPMETLQDRTQEATNALDLGKQQVKGKLGMPSNSRLGLQPSHKPSGTPPFPPGARGYSSLVELPPKSPHAPQTLGPQKPQGQAAGRASSTPFPSCSNAASPGLV